VKEEGKNDMQLLFGKRMDHSLSSLYLYSPSNEMGCLGVGLDVFLSLF